MTCLDPDDLPAALITHACGLTAASAANELICAHRDWLTNRDFTDGYITTGTHANGQAPTPTSTGKRSSPLSTPAGSALPDPRSA